MADEVRSETSTVLSQLNSSCSRIRGLCMQFEQHSRFFESLDHVFTQLVMKLQGLLDSVGDENSVNVPVTTHCLKIVKKYSEELVTAVDVCEQARKLRKRHMGELQILDAKLTTITEIFDYAVTMDTSDLYCFTKDHPRWQALLSHVTIHSFDHPETLQKHLKKIIYAISAGSAFVSKAYERTGKTSRKLMMGLGAVYYSAAKKKALRKARIAMAKASVETAKVSWNLMDSKIMAPMLEKMTVDIHVNKLIYIPRVTIQDVEIATSDPTIHLELPTDRVSPHFSFSKLETEDKIGLRILAPFAVPALYPNQTSCGCFGSMRATESLEAPKGVIFHIHGGGFIAMSSRSHQNYTRKWANELRTVVFSVDYRLAPEHAYPAAVDDVWAAYLWVVGFSRRCLGISAQEIVVTGDSAGGNLACALINKAIDSGIPSLVPKGGLLTYPALYLSFKRYSPSFEVALEDFIVHHTLLKICISSYLPSSSDFTSDYYAHPLLTPDANLSRFPPIRIMVGNSDPLEDDCWRFGERLIGAGGDFKMVLYEGLPHGFLGFDLKFSGVRETRVTIEQGSKYLKELLHLV